MGKKCEHTIINGQGCFCMCYLCMPSGYEFIGKESLMRHSLRLKDNPLWAYAPDSQKLKVIGNDGVERTKLYCRVCENLDIIRTFTSMKAFHNHMDGHHTVDDWKRAGIFIMLPYLKRFGKCRSVEYDQLLKKLERDQKKLKKQLLL